MHAWHANTHEHAERNKCERSSEREKERDRARGRDIGEELRERDRDSRERFETHVQEGRIERRV